MVYEPTQEGEYSLNQANFRNARSLTSIRQSGLTDACLTSPHTREKVAAEVLKYIKRWIPTQRVGVLAGNSVHADRGFLVEEMPEVVDWLHYRYVVRVFRASFGR